MTSAMLPVVAAVVPLSVSVFDPKAIVPPLAPSDAAPVCISCTFPANVRLPLARTR